MEPEVVSTANTNETLRIQRVTFCLTELVCLVLEMSGNVREASNK